MQRLQELHNHLCPIDSQVKNNETTSLGLNVRHQSNEIGDLSRIQGRMKGIEKRKDGMWWVVGFETAKALLDNTTKVSTTNFNKETIQDVKEIIPEAFDTLDMLTSWIFFQDPPIHTFYRSLFFKHFTSKKVAELSEMIEETCEKLIDSVEKQGKMDVRFDYSYMLSAMITARIMGAPLSDLETIKYIGHSFQEFIGTRKQGRERMSMIQSVVKKSLEYVEGLFKDQVSSSTGSNFIREVSKEVQARRNNGEVIQDKEIYSNIILLIFASADTVELSIPNAIVSLLQFPIQKEIFLNQYEEVKENAVEELLRFSGPVRIISRFATSRIHVKDEIFIEKGDTIVLELPKINRDPTIFHEPNQLNLNRNIPQHLGFGAGRHKCLGRFLAKLELQIAVFVIFKRLPNLRLAIPFSDLVIDDSLAVSGWKVCPVTF